jgi:hypothetical protein
MSKKIKWHRIHRKTHYWGAIICALPILIVIITGLFLLLRKDIAWIQPKTIRGTGTVPTLSFSKIMAISQSVTTAGIHDWEDVNRLDIRPNKGVVKIRSNTRWEIQLDQQTGDILQVAYRRSGLIESLHDGTFFHRYVSLGVFFPSAILLLILWITGIYMFFKPWFTKKKAIKK